VDNAASDIPASNQTAPDLRLRLAQFMVHHGRRLAWRAAETLIVDSPSVNVDVRRQIGTQLLELLVSSIRDEPAGAHNDLAAAISRTLAVHAITAAKLFAFVYVLEQTILEEIATDTAFHAGSDTVALTSQLVRRAAVDVLSRFAASPTIDSAALLFDPLTGLYLRPVFDTALRKELDRAGRSGYPVSMVLFDIDDLTAVNRQFGLAAGDRVLEALGRLVKTSFRQHDWAARYAGDSIAILLLDCDNSTAVVMADRMRQTAADSLVAAAENVGSAKVTISAAAITADVAAGNRIDPDRVVALAEGAVKRARQQGGNRVEAESLQAPTR
jgi:diguanylate cyclase (GGDEF)-like protein